MQEALTQLIKASKESYQSHLSHLDHDIVFNCIPSANLRLHFVKHDASGEPRFKELARALAAHIAVYCFAGQRLNNLSPTELTELVHQARDLFRKSPTSGQAGELLLYFLLEIVLGAPQALTKMRMTGNPGLERNGSDGLHIRWNSVDEVLEIIFAEAKLYGSFSDALSRAFKSIEDFHDSRVKQHEINIFTGAYSAIPDDLQDKVNSYVEGENVEHSRHVQACLIGFDWNYYKSLDDERRGNFVKEFDKQYLQWAYTVKDSLDSKLKECKHKFLRFEFFIIPFKSVQDFRNWFAEEAGISEKP